MHTQERTLRQKIDLVRQMMTPAYDWESHYEQDHPDDLDDLFRACVIVENAVSKEGKKYVSAGSACVENTPDSLYRILYLLKPKHLDFSDMYKTRLLSFFSGDRRFFIDIGLYNYEMDLRFYALRELVDMSEATGVYCGVPGTDNGYRVTDEDGKACFAMVKEAVEYTWCVYPGNDFEV